MKEFEVLYQDAFHKVYQYVYMLSHDRALAEDITQDTFVRAYEHFIVSGKLLNITWLYTVARNRYISLQRRKKFLFQRREKDHEGDLDFDIEQVPDLADTPEEFVLRNERCELVRKVLLELNEQFRTALILREYHQLSLKEITIILGVNESYGKQLLYKAREKFKVIYESKSKG